MADITPSELGIGPRPADGWTAVRAHWRTTTATRRLQLVLGLIWLLDAALQYQPYMFHRSFVTQILEPAAQGTPVFVERPSIWAAHFMLHHIGSYNACFATIQLVIALAILIRPFAKIGLAISIPWSLAVWWLGEGIGGIANGAMPIMGAPGAVVIYALLALLIWPRGTTEVERTDDSVAEGGPLGSLAPKALWSVLWWGLAALGLEGVNRSPSALHDMVAGMSDGEPGWIASMDRGLAAALAHHGTEWSVVLCGLFIVVGLGIWIRRLRRPTVLLACALALAIWLAEDFGGIFTGYGTDVNSGPLLALLAATFWPSTGRRLASHPFRVPLG